MKESTRVTIAPAGELKQKKAVYSPYLIGIFCALLTLGMFNLYSASGGSAIFYTQLKHMVIGLGVFTACSLMVSPRLVNGYAYWIFGITVALLVAVLIVGKVGGGSQRWIVVGPFRGQPSELAKIAIVVVVAKFFFTARQPHPYRIRDLWPLIAMVGLISGLIWPEPDFGTAGFCLLIALAQLCFLKVDRGSIALVTASGCVIAPIVWFFLLQDYQKGRILSFLNPEFDPHGKGYNALQSLVAIGSGGIEGKGFLQGTQTQLQFLPMRHTDFVFSVFAEEHGIWGCTILFLLFGGLTFIGLEIARRAKDTFSSLLAIGLASIIMIQFTINVAMVLRMFPVVGLPLPFFSYGGSSMITVCAALGLLISIDRDTSGVSRKGTSLLRTQAKAAL